MGPYGKGEIISYEQDVLKTMGEWVKTHQEALFGTAHDPFKKLEWGHCTVKGSTLYFFVVNWPKDRLLRIPGLKSEIKSAALLTKKDSPLAYSKDSDDLIITLPPNAPDDFCPVVAVKLGGELAIVDPMVKPDKQGQITLTRNEAIAYGHYDGMQYTSLNPNVRYGWDFSTSRAGDYSVKVSAVGVTGTLRISVGDQNVELKPGSVEVVTIHLPKNELLTLSLSGENPKRTIQGKIESVTLTPL
jgi:alpha-L-fucosidase